MNNWCQNEKLKGCLCWCFRYMEMEWKHQTLFISVHSISTLYQFNHFMYKGLYIQIYIYICQLKEEIFLISFMAHFHWRVKHKNTLKILWFREIQWKLSPSARNHFTFTLFSGSYVVHLLLDILIRIIWSLLSELQFRVNQLQYQP